MNRTNTMTQTTHAQTDSATRAESAGTSFSHSLLVALSLALVAAVWVAVPAQSSQSDSAQMRVQQQDAAVGTHSMANEPAATQFGSGMPAPSATATEGNVLDLTY